MRRCSTPMGRSWTCRRLPPRRPRKQRRQHKQHRQHNQHRATPTRLRSLPRPTAPAQEPRLRTRRSTARPEPPPRHRAHPEPPPRIPRSTARPEPPPRTHLSTEHTHPAPSPPRTRERPLRSRPPPRDPRIPFRACPTACRGRQNRRAPPNRQNLQNLQHPQHLPRAGSPPEEPPPTPSIWRSPSRSCSHPTPGSTTRPPRSLSRTPRCAVAPCSPRPSRPRSLRPRPPWRRRTSRAPPTRHSTPQQHHPRPRRAVRASPQDAARHPGRATARAPTPCPRSRRLMRTGPGGDPVVPPQSATTMSRWTAPSLSANRNLEPLRTGPELSYRSSHCR